MTISLGEGHGNGVYVTFSNISVISWQLGLLVEETGVLTW